MYAHGCFRFDCPPYHEQSEYLLSIYVIPRLISNGRVATPPNLTCVKYTEYGIHSAVPA
jgi:hypothetical protein